MLQWMFSGLLLVRALEPAGAETLFAAPPAPATGVVSTGTGAASAADSRGRVSAEEEALWRACQREPLSQAKQSGSSCYQLRSLRAQRGYVERVWNGGTGQWCSYDAWGKLLSCF